MKEKKTSFIMALFLLGIFMGAIDTGIVSPARELIQVNLGIERNLSTWMITLYTLVYAISMPIVSKMADRYGYKKVYIFGIATFGLGSLLCGLANYYGGFAFFLFARAVQAIGAGGIMPIANAVIGYSFPEGKRGSALGMVGMIYGIGNLLGPTLGSLIIDIAGGNNWGWIFFINVPISIVIVVLSLKLDNTKAVAQQPMDLAGALILAGVIGSLMYALTNLDLFNFAGSIKSIDVFPYLIVFALLTPIMIMVERKAKDPILNIKYFTNGQMLLVMILSFIVGVSMMGMIFVPQFSENVLRIKAGSGGYLITLLALFSGIAAPLSGKLIDKKGARFVLALGFFFNVVGCLFLALLTVKLLNFFGVLIGLGFMGLGMGFTIGAPLNYLVLQMVPKEEGTSGIATMSLMRSIGLALSPGLMIGFIVNAAKNLQNGLMDVLSEAMPQGMAIPTSNMGDGGSSGEAFKALQNADVTTIVEMLNNAIGSVVPAQVKPMIAKAIAPFADKITDTFQSIMNTGYSNMYLVTAAICFLGFAGTLLLKRKDVNISK